MKRAVIVSLCLGWLGASGCVYYNAMWSARRFAKEARRADAKGRMLEARTHWARAAVKAESVVTQHPRSRWAEEALVLQVEGLARSGACEATAGSLARAMRLSGRPALRERAALAAAECALEANDAVTAERRLAGVTDSRDPARRSRAEFLAGRAAAMQEDYPSAIEWYRRSREREAGPARARALLAAGRTAEAVTLFDTLARGRFVEKEWAAVLDALSRAAGPEAGSGALDRLLARRRVPAGIRARLLLADGDRFFAQGQPSAAAARYVQVAELVPDSSDGQRARVRQVRVFAAQAESLADLVEAQARLYRVTRTGAPSAAAGEARSLESLVRRVLVRQDVDEGAQFRTAELVRDSLGASRLAGRLFVGFARQWPSSIFAPKAVVAAAALLAEQRDSLIAVLDSSYPTSPYTRALRGEFSPAFAAAEDSLARALGLELQPPTAFLVSRVSAPVPGPRGPLLDAPPVATAARGAAAASPATSRQSPRPDQGRPARRAPGERLAEPRDTL